MTPWRALTYLIRGVLVEGGTGAEGLLQVIGQQLLPVLCICAQNRVPERQVPGTKQRKGYTKHGVTERQVLGTKQKKGNKKHGVTERQVPETEQRKGNKKHRLMER